LHIFGEYEGSVKVETPHGFPPRNERKTNHPYREGPPGSLMIVVLALSKLLLTYSLSLNPYKLMDRWE
jgi:hypothetical protein